MLLFYFFIKCKGMYGFTSLKYYKRVIFLNKVVIYNDFSERG